MLCNSQQIISSPANDRQSAVLNRIRVNSGDSWLLQRENHEFPSPAKPEPKETDHGFHGFSRIDFEQKGSESDHGCQNYALLPKEIRLSISFSLGDHRRLSPGQHQLESCFYSNLSVLIGEIRG